MVRWRALAVDPAGRIAERSCLHDEGLALAARLEAHLALEEAELFPVIRRDLSPEVDAMVRREMRARRG